MQEQTLCKLEIMIVEVEVVSICLKRQSQIIIIFDNQEIVYIIVRQT